MTSSPQSIHCNHKLVTIINTIMIIMVSINFSIKTFSQPTSSTKKQFFANDRGCLWKRYFSEISFSCRSSKNYDDWSVVGRIIICSIFTREDYQPITNHLQVISNHWMKFLKNNFFQRHPVQYMSKVLELQVSLTATADEFYKLAEHIYFGHCWTRHF